MEHVIWVEKYRPKTVKDCILPQNLKNTFQGIVQSNELPNLILSGGAGMGKTTIAKAMCDELGIDLLFINGSDERGIDVLRTKIKQYASSIAFNGKRKAVLLDEADYLTPETQAALRGVIEEFASNCSFILTCNFKNKIITALQSRCAVKDFRIPKEEKRVIYKQLFDRVCYILDTESVAFDKKVIAELIAKYFPDNRRLINEIQTFSKINGEINVGILSAGFDLDTSKLFSVLKEKDFNGVREWIVDNLDNDPSRIYRKIYDGLKGKMSPTSIPQAVLLLADYQYKSAFSVDQEICLLAFLTEIMVNCQWT